MAPYSDSHGAQRLVLVSCLPLVDGMFATLLVSGAIGGMADMVAVGLTVLAGAGSLAVLYTHAETPQEAREMVAKAVLVLFPGALLVGLIAPVFETAFVVSRLQVATGLAVLVVAGELADVFPDDTYAVHGILLTGLALSFQGLPQAAVSTTYLFPAAVTAATGIAALFVAGELLHRVKLSVPVVRKGGAAVLALIALSLFGLQVPAIAPLTVFGGAFAAAAGKGSGEPVIDWSMDEIREEVDPL